MRYTAAATLLLLALAGRAQSPTDSVKPLIKDTAWKAHGFFGLNANQTTLSDWQGGGQNNVAISGIMNLDILYKRDQFEQWQSKIDALFGLIKQGDVEGLRKNLDRLFVLTKYNTKAFGKHMFWSAQADYRTQFAPGYQTRGDTVVGQAISDFNSPGYVQLGLGVDYKPNDYFSFSVLPVAGKATIVLRQHLADEGAFGVKAAVRDPAGNVLTPGQRVRYEAGGRIIVKFKKDILKNVNLDSYLDLFSNYFHDFGNVDVIFNNMLTIKVAKFFTVNVISQILYDNDVIRKRDWNGDGKYDGDTDINGPRVQALTTLAIGIGYKF
jgi:hypothetical protein